MKKERATYVLQQIAFANSWVSAQLFKISEDLNSASDILMSRGLNHFVKIWICLADRKGASTISQSFNSEFRRASVIYKDFRFREH